MIISVLWSKGLVHKTNRHLCLLLILFQVSFLRVFVSHVQAPFQLLYTKFKQYGIRIPCTDNHTLVFQFSWAWLKLTANLVAYSLAEIPYGFLLIITKACNVEHHI